MRVNFFMLIISLIIAGLIFLGFYKWYDPENLIFSIGSAVTGFLLIAGATSVSLPAYPRSTVMMRTASGTLFVLLLIANICLAAFGASDVSFIIVNGIMLCIWAAVIYGVGRSKQ